MADDKQLKIRIPPDLHEKVSNLADQDLRSMSAEIIVLLREAVAQREAKEQKEGGIRAPGGLAMAFNH